MSQLPSFSIVVNTLNRGAMLAKTLASFQWLRYGGEFEVIVVNGPSTDNSAEIIDSWSSRVKVGHCDHANLSVSRNIGICMAAGDVVVFIDDDAVPEPEWLAQLAQPYSDPMVGAAGGFVIDHTGCAFQYRYGLVDRFANADLGSNHAHPELCFPKSPKFPHLLGCNASFRREALLEIGGFDEEYEYFLDETDVCLRIVDAGFLIAQLPNAFVHHKYAPSDVRGENRIPRNRYPIIKNKVYFTLKHAREFFAIDRVLQEQQSFVNHQRNEVTWAQQHGLLTADDVIKFEADVSKAFEIGLARGYEGALADALITPDKLAKYAQKFRRFEPKLAERPRSIVLVSKDFPPGHGGGVATFNKDLADALAELGHTVHVVTASPEFDRVDFENGVWVHRIVIKTPPRTREANLLNVPDAVWNWSATALAEVQRIASHRTVDVVEAPIWDCEGTAFLLHGEWPLVTSLQTTMHFWLDSHPTYRGDSAWMKSFGLPVLELERLLMSRASAVRSISAAIRDDIEAAYQITLPSDRVCVAHLGVPDDGPIKTASESMRPESAEKPSVAVLFVGRLEARKGIDVLLEAIPLVTAEIPSVRFQIVGDDSLARENGDGTYRSAFNDRYGNQAWARQVEFAGKVDDAALRSFYRGCDLFVAPSRFESFGLVFLEAMRVAKPVIGCAIGGMKEIVRDDVNGILIEPGDPTALARAILKLVRSTELRTRMGNAGRAIYAEHFTALAMARRSIGIFELAINNGSPISFDASGASSLAISQSPGLASE